MAKRARRGWGHIRKLPSGRYQGSYVGPDAVRHLAPRTFSTRDDATAWLVHQRRSIELDTWTPPSQRNDEHATPLFATYAREWLDTRTLRPRTRDLYEVYLPWLLAYFGDVPVDKITAALVRKWWGGLTDAAPAAKRHAYALLRAIMSTAADEEHVLVNPVRIKGATAAKRARPVVLLSPRELDGLSSAMPDGLELSVLIAGWCALRFGELSELRRRDLSADLGTVHVRRSVSFRKGSFEVAATKSEAGLRDVSVPPHLKPAIEAHLERYVDAGGNSLLFPGPSGGHLHAGTYRRYFMRAAAAIGRDGIRVHDLRHIGAVRFAQAGATIAELQARLGHSSPAVAMRYQHAAHGRDAEIARRLSAMALDEEL